MSDFISSKHIKKTRKEHKCAYCGRKIDIGESCANWVGKFDGYFECLYGCQTCHELRDYFSDDGYCDPDYVQSFIDDKIYKWKCPICDEERDDFDLDTKNNVVEITCCGSLNHKHIYDLFSLVQENKFIKKE
jgi:rubrerythrin